MRTGFSLFCRFHRSDLIRDVILERLDRVVGDGNLRVTVRLGAPLVRLVHGRLVGKEVGQPLLLALDEHFRHGVSSPRLHVTSHVTANVTA